MSPLVQRQPQSSSSTSFSSSSSSSMSLPFGHGSGSRTKRVHSNDDCDDPTPYSPTWSPSHEVMARLRIQQLSPPPLKKKMRRCSNTSISTAFTTHDLNTTDGRLAFPILSSSIPSTPAQLHQRQQQQDSIPRGRYELPMMIMTSLKPRTQCIENHDVLTGSDLSIFGACDGDHDRTCTGLSESNINHEDRQKLQHQGLTEESTFPASNQQSDLCSTSSKETGSSTVHVAKPTSKSAFSDGSGNSGSSCTSGIGIGTPLFRRSLSLQFNLRRLSLNGSIKTTAASTSMSNLSTCLGPSSFNNDDGNGNNDYTCNNVMETTSGVDPTTALATSMARSRCCERNSDNNRAAYLPITASFDNLKLPDLDDDNNNDNVGGTTIASPPHKLLHHHNHRRNGIDSNSIPEMKRRRSSTAAILATALRLSM